MNRSPGGVGRRRVLSSIRDRRVSGRLVWVAFASGGVGRRSELAVRAFRPRSLKFSVILDLRDENSLSQNHQNMEDGNGSSP
jgi:hypothetical protein